MARAAIKIVHAIDASQHDLVAFGQIVLRRIDGHEPLPAFLAKEWCPAA
ncbi:MAG TPA: hypothetical protein VEL79_02385 [Vicinamibacterales bacterium]|nr:hypothetical protein [Vicinamibacterales bacterium]